VRERKKKESVSEEITMQEWEEYFMKLLEGGNKNEGEADGVRENRNHSERGGETNKETKKKKVPGRDGVQNEAWMNGTERMVERMVKLMNGVWRGDGSPSRLERRRNLPNF
jgi:hypothetical protein